jgi:hypothetical protein
MEAVCHAPMNGESAVISSALGPSDLLLWTISTTVPTSSSAMTVIDIISFFDVIIVIAFQLI